MNNRNQSNSTRTANPDSDDFYHRLGIGRDSDDETIRKAYRRLAFQYHPDRNDESQREVCADRFARLTEAYETLIDVYKRDVYDRFGIEGLKQQQQMNSGAGNGTGGFGGGYGGDATFFTDGGLFTETFGNDFFETLFGGSRSGNGNSDPFQRFHNKREDVFIPIEVSLNELFHGSARPYTTTRTVICGTCKGSGAKSSEHIFFCKACKGTGIRVMRRTLPRGIVQQFSSKCTDCEGRGQFITEKCPDCKGRQLMNQKKTIHVKVYPGMKHGQKIVLKGEGDEWPGKITADLIFIVQQVDHPVFARRGDDLYITKSISLLEALTGFELTIDTLDPNTKLHVTVDEVIQPGMAKAILGEGMPVYNPSLASASSKQESTSTSSSTIDPSTNKRGALVVVFEVVFPMHLNPEMKSYLKLLMDPKARNKASSIPVIDSLRQQTEEWRKQKKTIPDEDGDQKSRQQSPSDKVQIRNVTFEPGHFGSVQFKQPYRPHESTNEESSSPDVKSKNKRSYLSSMCAQQ